MTLLNNTSRGVSKEALALLHRCEPGTPVNSPQFTIPGKEMTLTDYLHLFRYAKACVKVFVVTHVYAHQYNWVQQNGVWVNEENLAKHAKISVSEFREWRELTLAYAWLHLERKQGKDIYFPAIGFPD